MQRTAIGTAAVVLALGAIGCGGSHTLTRAEFTRQANHICDRAATRAFKRAGELLERYVVVQRRKASGIGSLTPPPELRTRYDAYTRVLATRISLFEQALAAVHAKRSSVALTTRSARLQAQERRLARALGLAACELHG